MKLPLYDLEGVLVGHEQYQGQNRIIMAVTDKNGRLGKRTFWFRDWGSFWQRDPVEWPKPCSCADCNKVAVFADITKAIRDDDFTLEPCALPDY